ncbi:MAG: DUF423 domain-containing protein [Alphaproteobacteria bacterium]|nr:DUF423 domain-containing protein [Alphaproteobacteria bacterium]
MNALRALAALAGFLAVGFGAFGAHALSASFDPRAADLWDTATTYALVHAVAAYAARPPAAAAAFLVGIALFAGSLYALGLGAPSVMGAITPLGGVSFLAGWTIAGVAALRKRD